MHKPVCKCVIQHFFFFFYCTLFHFTSMASHQGKNIRHHNVNSFGIDVGEGTGTVSAIPMAVDIVVQI